MPPEGDGMVLETAQYALALGPIEAKLKSLLSPVDIGRSNTMVSSDDVREALINTAFCEESVTGTQ